MAAIFSEVFFLQVTFWLFVAVTLLQMTFSGVVLWAFYSGIQRNCLADNLNSSGSDKVAGRLLLTGLATEKIIRPSGAGGVSVIVCARNEAENLRRNLPAILAQQYPGEWELIVVDDASDDETGTILLDFQRKNNGLRLLKIDKKKHPGKKQALTAGIEAAKFDGILLTDADCTPASQNWISHMMAPLMANATIELVLGYGPMKRSPNGGFLEKWTRFETAFTAMQYFTLARAGIPYMGVGRNLAFRKTVFQRAGGFLTHLHIASGDDDLLVNAVATTKNTDCCRHPESFVYAEGKQTWQSWARQKKRHLAAGTVYKWQHQALLGMLSLSHTLHSFLFFLLLLLGFAGKIVLYLWLSRSLFLFFMYRKIFSDLREHGLLSLLPIFDALLAVYFGAFIPGFLIGKKTHSWR